MPILRKVPIGRRVRLSDGCQAVRSAEIQGDVFVRRVIEEFWEWAPGKFDLRLGEIEIRPGSEPVEEI